MKHIKKAKQVTQLLLKLVKEPVKQTKHYALYIRRVIIKYDSRCFIENKVILTIKTAFSQHAIFEIRGTGDNDVMVI